MNDRDQITEEEQLVLFIGKQTTLNLLLIMKLLENL
jgi:hypothetical protein